MANESSGIIVNGSYINGVDKTKSWYPKLMEAGCSVTKTGNLKVPDGREPIELMSSLFGSGKVAKYVSVNDLTGGAKKAKAAEKEPAFSVVEVEGVAYINGIRPDSAWHKKLVDAGCSTTKTGGLKIPEGKNAPKFLNETLGKENMLKYGGYKYTHPEVARENISKHADKPKPRAAKEEKAFAVIEKGGKAYINGIKPDSAWHKKLVDAGCSTTKTGGLKIPEGKNAPKFLNETLGKENMLKYGGYEYTKEAVDGSKKKDETLADILKNRPEYMDMSPDEASAALAQEMAGRTASQDMQQN